MIFENQQYLYLVILAPVIGAWLVFFFRRRAIVRHRFADDELLNMIAPVQRPWVPYVRVLLITLAVFLIVLAFARPKGGMIEFQTTAEGIDIMLVLDLSKSMVVEDVGMEEGVNRSRMFYQKEIAKAIIESHPYDRIGIIGFTGEPFIICPLTLDHATVLTFLDSVNVVRSSQNPGTAIGDALQLALNRFEGEHGRAIVLFTDGENNKGSQPVKAARDAVRENIRIYTIGIGTENGTRLFDVDDMFRVVPRTFKNEPVIVKLDKTTLKEIASIANGKSYFVETFMDAKDVFVDFDRTSKAQFKSGVLTRKEDQAHLFILFAILLLTADFVIDKFRLMPRSDPAKLWIESQNARKKRLGAGS